ncbi:DUF547 domain-containing protein [Hymenobacter psoromatis]|uniref:DUF547 domain-containing protein n=1 Tax=Hymenobacter psoromatis TaxID=1484116 RepID=UPI001CC17824|nr:DUF547 domain-containing protein [Hymenobacter psoromatis]
MKTSAIVALAAGTLAALAGVAWHLQSAPTLPYTASRALISHGAYDQLLRRHVSAQGLVDYPGFRADEAAFNQYLALLSQNPPAANWSRNDQLAYWINAYNAYTIRLILNHYPVKSIKDIGPRIQIPFLTTPWADKFFRIGSQPMSLDNIEHGMLRQQFEDPRIHFALVCASLSCPRLRNEAYTAAQLDAQLADQGHDFLNNPAKNKISRPAAQLSKYFDWYKGDWEQNGQSVVQWVNRYSIVQIDGATKISYLDYNWGLNTQ